MIRCFKDRSLQELTLDKDRAAPQAPALRRGQRKVQPRAVPETIPQDLTPRKSPLAPPPIFEEVPAKLTTTFTLDVLQPFMRTSMENYYIGIVGQSGYSVGDERFRGHDYGVLSFEEF